MLALLLPVLLLVLQLMLQLMLKLMSLLVLLLLLPVLPVLLLVLLLLLRPERASGKQSRAVLRHPRSATRTPPRRWQQRCTVPPSPLLPCSCRCHVRCPSHRWATERPASLPPWHQRSSPPLLRQLQRPHKTPLCPPALRHPPASLCPCPPQLRPAGNPGQPSEWPDEQLTLPQPPAAAAAAAQSLIPSAAATLHTLALAGRPATHARRTRERWQGGDHSLGRRTDKGGGGLLHCWYRAGMGLHHTHMGMKCQQQFVSRINGTGLGR